MTTKSYLQQIERLEKMIQNKLSEIYRLKTMACSVSVSNENEKVQTSSDKDQLGATVAKLIDVERETNALVDSFINKRNHIIKQIDDIENTDYYSVLSLYYISGYTIEEIASKMNYTTRNVFKIRNKALDEFCKKYGHEYENL